MSSSTYFAVESFGVRTPYFSISAGGYNLTPIPPKYIKSLSVTRLKDGAAGTFSISLVAPIHTFSKGSDSLSLILTYLLTKSQLAKPDEKTRCTILYGWTNGAKVLLKDAAISSFNFSYAEDNTFVSYSISGAVEETVPFLFSTNIYNRQNTIMNDSSDELGDIVTLNESNNWQVSNIIEKIAKYIYPGYTILVDKCDRSFKPADGKAIEVSTALSFSTNTDGSTVTLQQYFDKLIGSCKEWKPTGYKIEKKTDNNSSGYGISEFNSAQLLGSNGEYLPNVTAGESYEATRPIGTRGNVSKYTVSGDALLNTALIMPENFIAIEQGESGSNYTISYDVQKKYIKISPYNSDADTKTFIIDNNHPTHEVLSFSISSDGIPATGALMAIDSGKTESIEVSSGLSIASSTNLGGAVPISNLKLEALYDAYSSKLAEIISSNTSKATLKIWGSVFSVQANLAETKIQVYPLINSGETFWCGKYNIFGITDSVDENGFTTEFSLKFDKSKFSEDYNKATDKQGTT